MNANTIVSFAGSILAIALAVTMLWREKRSAARTSFTAALFLLALEGICDGLVAAQSRPESVVALERLRLFVTAFWPGIWLRFSLCYSRGNAREFLARNRVLIALFLFVPLATTFLFNSSVIAQIARLEIEQAWYMRLAWPGIVLQTFLLLGSALALINLERTFRTAIGTMRWRIKYLVLGCAVLLGARLYTSSQAILFTGIQSTTLEVQSVARLVGYSLIGFSLLRSRLAEIEIYPSHEFVYRSLTALLVGAYLLVVGVLGKIALFFQTTDSVPLKSLIILIAIVGTSALLLSDRIRRSLQQLVTRHLRRPIHDYRKVWTMFAERTAPLVNREDLCRESARLISETFSVLSVTIFTVDDQRHQLQFGASTALREDTANRILSGANVSSLVDWPGSSAPVDMDSSQEPWLLQLKALSPDFFQKGGGRVCVPLVASRQFLGLITLTDRVSGVPFSPDDFELLKCVGAQVSANLLNIHLAARLMRSKELEAFQTMSTFFVHDLKNTALMLSLMLKNLPIHFANPDFREDSLRAISKTVDRINDLISRLTLLRKGLEIHPVETDLNALVVSCLGTIPRADVDLQENLQPLPKVKLDPEQIQKVFTNLVLNARDAVGQGGHIRISTNQTNGWAVLQVTDDGCGISPEFLQRSLFRPFQTTKKKGIGIGMYQSKMIVEAHSGRIEVQSEVGKGTTFRVLLPIKNHS